MIKNMHNKMIILFLAPALILYVFLFVYPAIKAFYVSMFDWSGFTADMDFVGAGNFVELSKDSRFWNVAVKNTFGIIFFGGILLFGLAFLISGVLSTNIKGKKFFRAIVFLPTIINPVAVGILWGFIYNRNWGLLNNILSAVGLGSLQRTWTGPESLFWAILVALVWAFTGFFCIVMLAALDRVPSDVLESASLDGAGELRIFFTIKIPLIWDVLTMLIIFWVITAIKEFALLFVWGGGVDIPPDAATNIAVAVFVSAFGKRVTSYRMGYATAMGVIMFIMVFVSVFVISKITKKEIIEY